MEYYTLNNGIKIPAIGSGTNTFGKVDRRYMNEINHDTTEIDSAIRYGYRLFDTAIAYRNESVLGDAIQKSGLNRASFFITSKIPNKAENIETEEAIINSIQGSLKALNTDYIDLYLIHHPWDDNHDIVRVWNTLESYVDQGILKSIGVSNFSEQQLAFLLNHARIKPVVNQIESHPGNWQHELIAFSKSNQVIPQAWGPISRVSDEAKIILSEIGSKYNKTWAQVILRFQLERGVILIPKSHNEQRQKENLDIFDFELTENDKEVIYQL